MKITRTINHEGHAYQFAAIELGEKVRKVREELGWEISKTFTFYAEDEPIANWKHWFDKAGIEFDANKVIAVIEHHLD